MKVLIMSDSYKGTASSLEIGKLIEKGIKRVDENIHVQVQPVADGGEGTLEVLSEALGAKIFTLRVKGPLGTPVKARIARRDDTWIIEMAEASGLHTISFNERNPLKTSTYGTGELLRYALNRGAKKIYLGLGGSATNDGGAGALSALGAHLIDYRGNTLKPGGFQLRYLREIDLSRLHPGTKDAHLVILSDVKNPLCGPDGATKVFGKQKGLFKEKEEALDKALFHYGSLLEEKTKKKAMELPGAGAAGGLGFMLYSVFNCEVRSGIECVLELMGIESLIKEADLIITGEGRLDDQSLKGKTPIGVSRLAKKYHKPVIAIVGTSDLELGPIYEGGIDLVIDLSHQASTMKYLIKNMDKLVPRAGEMAMRAFMLGRKE